MRKTGDAKDSACPGFRWRAILQIVAGTLGPLQAVAQEPGTHFDISDPKNSTAVVATVGNITITAQQFLLSYEFGPAFAKREKDSKKKYLGFMVNEKLLALDASERGVSSSPVVARTLAEFEGDLATEELYKDDVLSKVKVSESEVEQAVREEQMHLTLQWLYTKSESEARRLRNLLAEGIPFDSLFREQANDSVSLSDRSMEISRFKLRSSNPLLSSVADTLKPGVASPLIKAPDGWYIVNIAEVWRDALTTESEMNKLRYDARRALTQQKADSLSDRYVRNTLLRRDPVIIRTTFDLLRAYLGSVMLPAKQFDDWKLSAPLTELHPVPDWTKIDGYGDDTLVTLKKGALTLGKFLLWYRARDTAIRLNPASPQAFFLSLEDLIWRMVRDTLLVERARSRKLQNRSNVKKQVKWWEEKVLYEMEKTYLAGSIRINDSLLTAFYMQHLRNYRDSAGVPQEFGKIREEVRKDYYSAELTAKIFHRLVALKRKFRVDIREKTLARLPVEEENQPRAIDVYTVKTGGIFPRPAFPVIDYAWQSWD